MKIALALIIAAVLTFIAVRWQTLQWQRFAATAVKTEGEIVSAGDVLHDPKNQRKEFIVHYRYTDAEGTVHENKERIEFTHLHDQFTAGKPITVWYDPKNPTRSMLAPLLEERLR